ncbi:MAG TPA: hypothetical protein VFR09_07595 [Alphaproteobacteria bacterium]|nr:hypothetical protein [Alphaproteobacteria bacterium]
MFKKITEFFGDLSTSLTGPVKKKKEEKYAPYDPATEDWSDQTLADLVLTLHENSPDFTTGAPIKEIAIVGANISPAGMLTARDADYIREFFMELTASGLPIDPNANVINYNLNNANEHRDIFDRIQPVDALMTCHLNFSTKTDDVRAPTITADTKDDSANLFYHISPKSIGPSAWHDLAVQLGARVIGIFGYKRCVNIAHFQPALIEQKNIASDAKPELYLCPSARMPFTKDTFGGMNLGKAFEHGRLRLIVSYQLLEDSTQHPLPANSRHRSEVVYKNDSCIRNAMATYREIEPAQMLVNAPKATAG